MNFNEYYKIIKSNIEADNFSLKVRKGLDAPDRNKCISNSHLETIHFLLFDYMVSNNDIRRKDMFDYVCVPNDVNKIDMSKMSKIEFIKNMIKIKD
jgi:hypothetical protein